MVALITLLGLYIVWAGVNYSQRRNFECLGSMDWAAAALVGAYVVSTFVALDPRTAVQEDIKHLLYFLIFIFISRLAYKSSLTEYVNAGTWFLRFVVLATTYVSAIGVLAAAGWFNYAAALIDGRIASTMQYPNSLAAYLTVGVILSVALGARAREWREQALMTGITSSMLLTFVFTESRGAWMLFPVATAALIAAMPRGFRIKTLLLVLAATLPLIVAVPIFGKALAAKNGSLAVGTWVLASAGGAALAILARAFLRLDSRKQLAGGAAAALVFLTLVVVVLIKADTLLPASLITKIKDINLETSSAIGRVTFTRDGFKIVKDYPILGTGGGGWGATYFKYRSYTYFGTVVHNEFLETWISTGTVGLIALLALWGGFFGSAYKAYRRTTADNQAILAGSAVAAAALGVHSAQDFNLSLGAISIVLWTLFGLVHGLSAAIVHDYATSPGRTTARAGAKITLTRQKSKNEGRRKPSLFYPVTIIIAVAVIAFSAALLVGAGYGEAGARALNNGRLDEARVNFDRALQWDPFTASFHIDLGQTYARLLETDQKRETYLEARQHFERGLEMMPTNPKFNSIYAFFLLRTGQLEEASAAFEKTLALDPYQIENYESLAAAESAVARAYLDQGKFKEAESHLLNAIAVPDRLKAQRVKVPARIQPHLLMPETTPRLSLNVGSALALMGRWTEAEGALTNALADGRLEAEASMWLTIMYHWKGDAVKERQAFERLKATGPSLIPIYERLVKLRPVSVK
ncbi:MAG: tetratricopeptide repeat protein [Actinobacteria bacterium]|nr:tetratricopeptide repeat protein [Actinomycetota bacterium]